MVLPVIEMQLALVELSVEFTSVLVDQGIMGVVHQESVIVSI